MQAERVSMRHVREVLRLKFDAGVPGREIARRLGILPTTVRETLKRVGASSRSPPMPGTISWRFSKSDTVAAQPS